MSTATRIGIVDNSDQFISDVECLLNTRNSSGNDIKIILKDGEIFANKGILMARCDYFKTMFHNEYQFKEGETNSVDMRHCSKVVMKKIIIYLFSGKMKLDDISFPDGIRLLNMARLMMMGDLCDEIDTYLLRRLPVIRHEENVCQLPELLEGLVLIEQFKLDYFKADSGILIDIFLRLEEAITIPEIVLKADVFKSFPESLLKDILMLHIDPRWSNIFFRDFTKARYNAFTFWFSDNKECSEETKKKIVDSFDLSKFSGKELVTNVRKSGFFSDDQIEQGLLKIIKKKDQTIQFLEDRLHNLQPGE